MDLCLIAVVPCTPVPLYGVAVWSAGKWVCLVSALTLQLKESSGQTECLRQTDAAIQSQI